MPKKKSLENSKVRGRAKAGSRKGIVTVRVHTGSTARPSRRPAQPHSQTKGRGARFTLGLPGERESTNGTRYEHPRIKNPAVPGDREKMLEERAKLTLKAFRIAYENHRRP